MQCRVCHYKPRMFEMFGGGYWHTVGAEHWVCPLCAWWAWRVLGEPKRLLDLDGRGSSVVPSSQRL